MTTENRVEMHWALICSIKEDEPTEKFEEFAEWLTEKMAEHSRRMGLYHKFAAKPDCVLRSRINNQNDNAMNYREIHDLHPSVLLVVHILPGENSNEYVWMREFTQRYGLIRQGIQRDNAEKRFEGANLDLVLGNINQWIARRLYQLVTPDKNVTHGHRIQVGFPGNNNNSFGGSGSSSSRGYRANPAHELSSAVSSVLHYDPEMGAHNNIFAHADAVCEVTGLPSEFNEFQLAAVFHRYKVKSVIMGNNGTAVVEFFNKFHACQASLDHHTKKVDHSHQLSVVPIHQITRMQAGITI
ncbi:hypothetical protein L596_007766 [Steinernema carpocapsae]|uniref:RRM domain-containing protein n=1 Tax=Steinernema carpocapsae TaxID=34508 RepID=A0A4U5PAR0_STECR|nr:hypothetical protein L596_007766 [Steinernema carpocapsae]